MYTNICTTHGLEILEKWIDKFSREGKLEDNLSIDIILALTKLIMENNYFRFGDTEWLQLIGTAMGTPMACAYATFYFAWHKMTVLLTK